ncbi:transglutaminase-like superfamily protein [bacterium BMS3Bbin03]|nr:transglutaminase-like superfamily protein [bacterium BMS3Bbin03]
MKTFYKTLLFLLLSAAVVNPVFAQHKYSQEEVQGLIENAPNAADYPQASAVILLHQKILTVHEDGSSTLDEHLLIKILKHRGKQKYGDQKRKYNAETDSIQVLRAVTYKFGGKVIAVEKKAINDITPLELTGASVYANVLEKVISFPALAPNVVMELKLRTVSKAPKEKSDRHYWGLVGFQTDDPILRKEFVLIVPKTMDATYAFLHKNVEPEETTFADRLVYNWRVEKSPQIISEPDMPPFEEIIPLLAFSSQKKWENVGAWLKGKFYKHITQGDSIRAQAQELTKAAKNRSEKIRNTFLFVAQKIRNVYLKLGLAGYEPHDADSVLANRYGDWRDKAVLLVALLKAAGIESYPAFVQTQPQKLIASVPMPKQFNAVYVAVPQKDGQWLWLNPFADYSRYPYFLGAQGNQALVLEPEKAVLKRVKQFSPDFNFSHNQMDFTLDTSGNVTTKIISKLNGFFDLRARRALKGKTPKELEQYFLETANQLGEGSTEISHKLSNLKDLVDSVVVEQTAKTPELGIVEGKMMIFHLPHVPFGFAHNPFFPSLEKRKFDFVMDSNVKVVVEGDVNYPQNYKAAFIPQAFTKKNAIGEWKIRFTDPGSGKIHYKYEYRFNKTWISLKNYSGFKQIFDAFQRPQNGLILLEKK